MATKRLGNPIARPCLLRQRHVYAPFCNESAHAQVMQAADRPQAQARAEHTRSASSSSNSSTSKDEAINEALGALADEAHLFFLAKAQSAESCRNSLLTHIVDMRRSIWNA